MDLIKTFSGPNQALEGINQARMGLNKALKIFKKVLEGLIDRPFLKLV